MSQRHEQLNKASRRAKELIESLKKRHPDTEQWDYKKMEGDLNETYHVLRHAWKEGKSLETVREFLSDEGYSLLNSDSKLGNIDAKYLDLLNCFDAELEGIEIIGVINFPGDTEDYFVAWLDNEYHKSGDGPLNINLGFTDNFPNLSGFNLWNIFKMAPNDCWTFKWSSGAGRWVLHNITFDNTTDAYLKVLSKSIDIAEDGQFAR